MRSGCEPFGVYAATKSAVDTLTKFGALEGASTFVRVTAVNVGLTGSDGAVSGFGGADAFAKITETGTLLAPALSVDEAAASVIFLTDNKTGRLIHGATFKIDGGSSLK